MRNGSPLTRDAVRWLARLPFLGVHDLALLTGQPAPENVMKDALQRALRPA